MQIYMDFHSAEDEQRTGLGLYVHEVHHKKQSQYDISSLGQKSQIQHFTFWPQMTMLLSSIYHFKSDIFAISNCTRKKKQKTVLACKPSVQANTAQELALAFS